MRFRMDPRAKLYLLLLANLMLFFHVGTGAEAVATGLFLLLFFLSGHTRTGIRLSVVYFGLLAIDLFVVPLEVMTACGEGIALAAEYAEKGSVLARSDAGCAALFCKAAMQAAGLNVKVNTRLMADKAHADALEARAEQLLAEFVPQADRVYQTVSNE